MITYDIDTRILDISISSNGVRVYVIYLITITLIKNRKTDTQ